MMNTKLFGLLFSLILVFALLASCESFQKMMPQPDDTDEEDEITTEEVEQIPDAESLETDSDAEILRKYRKEGFIDAETYAVIIVQPAGSSFDEDDIREQAKKRTYVSFQKYKREHGSRITQNTQSSLLNLINDYGKLERVEDTAQSRTVFIYVVKREQLKRYIDGL